MSRTRDDALHRFGGTALVLTAAVLCFGQTWRSMALQWQSSPAYAHGFAIPPMVVWLVWLARGRWQALPDRPEAQGLWLTMLAVGGWMLGRLAGVAVIEDAAAVAMLATVVLWRHGRVFTREIAYPLAFLGFMVPAWDSLVPTLTEWTALATEAALRAIGIPVHRDGGLLALPTGQWSVVEACSGLHYLIVAVLLAALFGHLYLGSVRRRVALLLAVVLVALVTNWFRAFVTVLMGHLTELRWGQGDEHLILGWGLFGVTLAATFALARRMASPTGMQPAPSALLIETFAPAAERRSTRIVWPVSVLCGLALGAHLLTSVLLDMPARPGFAQAATEALGPFEPMAPSRAPAYQGHREGLQGHWPDGVDFTVRYWAQQEAGAELVGHAQRVLPEGDPLSARGPERLTHPQAGEVKEWLLRGPGGTVRAWLWYVVDGSPTASRPMAKALGLRGVVSGRGDHAALAWLVIAASEDAATDRAQLAAHAARLNTFLADWTGRASRAEP